MNSYKKVYSHYIDGKMYRDNSNNIDIFNPSTGESMGFVSSASKNTVDLAIESSKKAFLKYH